MLSQGTRASSRAGHGASRTVPYSAQGWSSTATTPEAECSLGWQDSAVTTACDAEGPAGSPGQDGECVAKGATPGNAESAVLEVGLGRQPAPSDSVTTDDSQGAATTGSSPDCDDGRRSRNGKDDAEVDGERRGKVMPAGDGDGARDGQLGDSGVPRWQAKDRPAGNGTALAWQLRQPSLKQGGPRWARLRSAPSGPTTGRSPGLAVTRGDRRGSPWAASAWVPPRPRPPGRAACAGRRMCLAGAALRVGRTACWCGRPIPGDGLRQLQGCEMTADATATAVQRVRVECVE